MSGVIFDYLYLLSPAVDQFLICFVSCDDAQVKKRSPLLVSLHKN